MKNNMPEKSEIPISRSTTEIVNLLLALFSWILPDITVEIKIAISIVLISMLLISRLNPKFITRTVSTLRYFFLIASPIVIGLLESWVVWLLFPDNRLNIDFSEATQGGFAFGLVFGLPILIIGMWTSKNKGLGTASLLGLILEIFRLVYVSGSPDNLSELGTLEALGPWILMYVSIVHDTIANAFLFYAGIFLQNFQFELIGSWIIKLWSDNPHFNTASKQNAG
jgi:hypothetical protein